LTLKVERDPEVPGTTIRLIGRGRAEQLAELEKQIRESGSQVVIDLEEVEPVKVDVVRFFGICDAQGITLFNCAFHTQLDRQRAD
jgi:hypothetical protein